MARQDLALDARYVPVRGLTLTGYGLLSLAELRIAEGTAAVTWQAHRTLQLSVDYHRTAPDLFVPLNSIFSVFSQETRDEVGGAVFYRPIARLRFDGDYHVFLDEAGWGHRGGGRAQFSTGPMTWATEVRTLQEPHNGYTELRFWGMERWDLWLFSLDVDTYFLNQAINGQDVSFTTAATVAWDFKPGWRAVVTGMADMTPYVEKRVECLVKLVYNHAFRFREVKP